MTFEYRRVTVMRFFFMRLGAFGLPARTNDCVHRFANRAGGMDVKYASMGYVGVCDVIQVSLKP